MLKNFVYQTLKQKTLRELEWVFEEVGASIYFAGDTNDWRAVAMNLRVPQNRGTS
jgi:endonuclease/exonuclease/phosphatase (EEP) superfamily protein YafD